MSWFQTYTGIEFDFNNISPELINLEDIAHSLSNICRFGGHCGLFYSVAHHSLIMSHYADNLYNKKWALLHDATEAYVGDVIRPLKQKITGYDEIEQRVLISIAEKFGLSTPIPEKVKELDDLILQTERRFFWNDPINCGEMHSGMFNELKSNQSCRNMTTCDTKNYFIERFKELWTGEYFG